MTWTFEVKSILGSGIGVGAILTGVFTVTPVGTLTGVLVVTGADLVGVVMTTGIVASGILYCCNNVE